MPLNPDQLTHVAHLARIALDAQQRATLGVELANIINWIEQLQTAAVDVIAPMAHPLGLTLPLRDDVATEPDQSNALLALTAETQSGLYLVPKVIE